MMTLLDQLRTQQSLQALTVTLQSDDSTYTIAGLTILQELMDKYGQRSVHYAEGLYDDAASAVLTQWTRMIQDNQDDLNRIYAAVTAEYKALSDYAETKTDELSYGHTETTDHGHVITDGGTRTVDQTYDSSQSQDVTPFNDETYYNNVKNTHEGTDTRTTTDDLTHTHSGSDTLTHSGKDTHTITTNGYKGQPADWIQREYEMRLKIDLLDTIVDSYARRYLYY